MNRQTSSEITVWELAVHHDPWSYWVVQGSLVYGCWRSRLRYCFYLHSLGTIWGVQRVFVHAIEVSSMPQAPTSITLNFERILDLSSLSFFHQHSGESLLGRHYIRSFSVKWQRCRHIWRSFWEVRGLLSFYLPLGLGCPGWYLGVWLDSFTLQ